MSEFNFVLLYVADPLKSAAFYSALLGKPIVEQSPTFAMVPLREGVMLGLWIRSGVVPKADAATGGSEVAFAAASDDDVRATFEQWQRHGAKIVQEPAKLDFGFAFTATDPDGHRLRVFCPAG